MDSILEEVKLLLSEVKSSDDGWPNISRKEENKLRDLLIKIIDFKYPRDCDNDSVLRLYIENRKKEVMLSCRTMRCQNDADIILWNIQNLQYLMYMASQQLLIEQRNLSILFSEESPINCKNGLYFKKNKYTMEGIAKNICDIITENYEKVFCKKGIYWEFSNNLNDLCGGKVSFLKRGEEGMSVRINFFNSNEVLIFKVKMSENKITYLGMI